MLCQALVLVDTRHHKQATEYAQNDHCLKYSMYLKSHDDPEKAGSS